MIRRILPILFFGIPASVCSADGPKPSCDCRRAQTPDEIAICSAPRLSEPDRTYARDFEILRQKDWKKAAEQGRDFIKSRRLCGNDRYCIIEQLQYMPGGSRTPAWLTEAFKAKYAEEVANDDLRQWAYAAIGVTGSFTTSDKGIQATVTSIAGPDTAHASADANSTKPRRPEKLRARLERRNRRERRRPVCAYASSGSCAACGGAGSSDSPNRFTRTLGAEPGFGSSSVQFFKPTASNPTQAHRARPSDRPRVGMA